MHFAMLDCNRQVPCLPYFDHICWFDSDAVAQWNAYNPQRNQDIVVDQAGIALSAFRLRQHRQLPVAQHIHFTPQKLYQKHSSNGLVDAAQDNPSEMNKY